MARSAIPNFGIEYPEYEFRPWPRQVGLDADGEQLVANNQDEFDALLPSVVFPKLMGQDKNGKDVIAHIPRDLEWKKSLVAKPPEDPAIAKKREDDAKAAEAERDRKAAAYDAMMQGQAGAAGSQNSGGVPTGGAANALTPKKTKAA